MTPLFMATACPSCGPGVVPLASRDGADAWAAWLAEYCPGCGCGPRQVTGPHTLAQLPADALDVLPPDWRDHLPHG